MTSRTGKTERVKGIPRHGCGRCPIRPAARRTENPKYPDRIFLLRVLDIDGALIRGRNKQRKM